MPEIFPSGTPREHNNAVTYGQAGTVCPQCGSAAAVHSVDELAAMARARLGQFGLGYQGPPPPGYQQPPGYQGPPPGYQPPPGSPPPPPASGFPSSSSGFPSAPLSSDLPPPPPPPPDYSDSAPPPGYSGQKRPGRWSRGSSSSSSSGGSSSGDDSIEDAVAGLVMDAATKFIGGAIGRRVKRAYEERVVPAVAAKQEAAMREQIAIAERYPDLRACLTDNVVFLAGGNRVVPMSSLRRGFTLEQADAVVAQLRTS
jgi:hypothetical protein